MNILFLAVDVDLRQDRGDSVHVRELYAHLVSLGHKVVLVTGTPGDAGLPEVAHVTRPDSFLSQVLVCLGIVTGWADVIYERRLSPKLSCAISILTGLPYVMEVNGVLEDEVGSEGRAASVADILKARIRDRMIRRTARIVAVSRGVRDHVLATYRLHPDHVIVVPNGANTTLFTPKRKQACRRELGLTDGPVLCFVGNMAEWQGVDDLLHSVAALKQRFPRITLLLVGDGPCLGRLRLLANSLGISRLVRFSGAVRYEKVPDYIGASDVCIAPFKGPRKASPIKVFEYLACGRPVVACDVDELANILGLCHSGLVVPPGNVEALSGAIEQLLRDTDEAEAMGKRGRAFAARGTSWEATSRSLITVLSRAVELNTAKGHVWSLNKRAVHSRVR